MATGGDSPVRPPPDDVDEAGWSSSFSDTGSDADTPPEPRQAPPAGAAGAAAGAAAGGGAAPTGGPGGVRVVGDGPAAAGDAAGGAGGDGGKPGGLVRDVSWRNYRRALEWRCRWVELRMSELRDQEARYARLEASAQRKRKREQPPQPAGEGGAEQVCACVGRPCSLLCRLEAVVVAMRARAR
jgi:hypothetical protein